MVIHLSGVDIILRVFLTHVCIILISFSCSAQEDTSIDRVWDFGIGIGYGNSSNPFAGSDDIPSYLTLDVSIYGKRFFFDNGELGFTVIDKPNFGVNIISTYNSERIYYSFLNDVGLNVISTETTISLASNNAVVEVNENTVITLPPAGTILPSPPPPGLNLFPVGAFTIPFTIPDRDLAINLGIELFYDTDFGSFGYQATKDISDTHTGTDMIVDFSKSWQKKRWSFSSTIGAHWKSAKLVDYYYGVGLSSSPFFNLSYNPGSSIDTFINFVANYRLSNNLSFVTSVKYNKFGAAIKNSPIINESGKHIIFTGLYYRF